MALPRIDTPTFQVTLPVSKKVVSYRPFLVKEQKILLMAMESQDEKGMENNIRQVLQNCVLDEIAIGTLPIVDIQYLLLQLRARSVGEIVESKYKCQHEIEGKECGHIMTSKFNLLETKVNIDANLEDKIQLSDKIGVKMKYPTFDFTKRVEEIDSATDAAFELLIYCIDYIYDENNVYYANETSREELVSFVESLTKTQFDKMENFLANMPSLNKKIDIKCEKCGYEHHLDVEGLESFFD